MAMIRLPEFTPDQPDYDNPGITGALNVIPLTKLSYGPWKQPAILSTNQMVKRCQGAVNGADYSGNIFVFSGDEGALYRYTGTTFTDVSKVAGYTSSVGYTDITSRAWYFEQYNNIMLATNFADPPQKWALGTDSAFDDMAPLTAPKARYMATVQNSLVLANTDDSFDGHIGLRIWFGPVGNPTDDDWGNTNKQSDFRTLPRGKEITGIVGGEYGIIFCKNAVYRMTYSGPPTIFQIDEIKESHGCIAPGSIATNEERTFYLSEHGYQMLVGNQSIPIGQEKVDDTIEALLDTNHIDRIFSVIDEKRNLYIVAIPTATSVDGTPNLFACFNWHSGHWSFIEETMEMMENLASPGVTIEELGALYPTVEDVPGAYENPAFQGGSDFLGAFSVDRNLNSFSGANRGYALDTAEFQLIEGAKAIFRNVRPVTDCDCVEMRIGRRDVQTQANGVAWSDAVSPNSITGLCSFKAKGRYHRARLEAPDGWTGTYVAGIDGLEFYPAGKK